MVMAFAAPLYVLVATLRRESGVPFWDEWEWADLAYQVRTGGEYLGLLWAPHNGHHNVVPDMIFLLIDRWSGWSPRAEELVGIAALIAAQTALWFVVKRSLRRFRFVAFAILSALLYNPAQYESFSMGFNVGWEICTAAIVVMVERLTSRDLSPLVVGQAALAALIGSLTSGQGLLLWPIGLAIVILRRPLAPTIRC